MDFRTYGVERPEVGVATGEEKVLAVQRELLAVGAHEAITSGNLGAGDSQSESDKRRTHCGGER